MNPPPLPKKRLLPFIKIGIYIGVLIFLPILGYSCSQYMSPQYGVNIHSASWMPPGASNGCFYHAGSFILDSPVFYYEFDISEDDFKTYLKSLSFQPMPIEKPQSIDRYLKAFIRFQDFEYKNKKENSTFVDTEGYDKAVKAFVTNGLFYFKQLEPDAYLHYVYDRTKDRAYIDITTR